MGAKTQAASFHINCDVTHALGKQPHACRPRHTRLPTPRHAREAWEAQRMKRLTAVKTAPPARAPFLGLAQRRDCAYVWPRPGGSCRCTKRGAHICTPFSCAWAVRAMPTATPSKMREVSQGKAEAQEKKNDAKTKTTKSKGDEADPPARSLPGGGFSKPGKTLAVAARPTPTE